MDADDEFKTIVASTHSEITVGGSRFIGQAMHVITREDAGEFIRKVRAEHHDATHNCFAYRLADGNRSFRTSDDGEPSGSGGTPILSAIDKLGLANTLVVVTRYFGGKKLGVGNLARAYGKSASEALSAASLVLKYYTKTMVLSFPHDRIAPVMRLISHHGVEIVDSTYDEDVHLTINVRRSSAEDFKAKLVDETRGNIHVILIAG